EEITGMLFAGKKAARVQPKKTNTKFGNAAAPHSQSFIKQGAVKGAPTIRHTLARCSPEDRDVVRRSVSGVCESPTILCVRDRNPMEVVRNRRGQLPCVFNHCEDRLSSAGRTRAVEVGKESERINFRQWNLFPVRITIRERNDL